MLISLRDSVSDSLKTYSNSISAYAHSYVDGVSLPLYETKPLPLPPPRCEGRRSGGWRSRGMCGAPLLYWDVLCGASSD